MTDQIANFITSLLGALTVGLIAQVTYLTRRLSRLEVHVAEQYVSKPELASLDEKVTSVQTQLLEIVKTLHEIKGGMEGASRR